MSKDVGDLGKIIVAKGFKTCPKSNKLSNQVTLVTINVRNVDELLKRLKLISVEISFNLGVLFTFATKTKPSNLHSIDSRNIGWLRRV